MHSRTTLLLAAIARVLSDEADELEPQMELAEELVKQLKRKTTRGLKLQAAAGREVFHPNSKTKKQKRLFSIKKRRPKMGKFANPTPEENDRILRELQQC